MQIHTWDELADEHREALLRRPALTDDAGVKTVVAEIINQLRQHGDHAVLSYTRQFDGVELDDLLVSDEEFSEARAVLTKPQKRAIDLAIANVRAFHERQRPVDIDVETMQGVRCQRISQPLQSVGLYVPAGSAPLPSAAIMLAVPAAIAGCPETIMCTPPNAMGRADAAVVVAARKAGVQRVYKVGGAQAIAAMAYGSQSIPRVEKIFGPGNAWVTAAKAIVAGDAGGAAIDMPAGPSEVLVIADRHANAAYIAADLLSQAEHGVDSQVLLLSTDADLAGRALTALSEQLDRLPRRDIARRALQNSHVIITTTIAEAISISNNYAPEHLILHTENGRALLPAIRHAGSVFIGAWSPESAGDYCSGTNHVLPTYGAAKRFSGLGVEQFTRHMTVQELSRDGLRRLAPAIIELAAMEGLDAHANAVRLRLADEAGEA